MFIADGIEKIPENPNVISSGLTPNFTELVKHIFQDSDSIHEEYVDHDEVSLLLVQQVDKEFAEGVLQAVDCGKTVEQLVGTWGVECTRSNSNGVYWDYIWEFRRYEQVEETITRTVWKQV